MTDKTSIYDLMLLHAQNVAKREHSESLRSHTPPQFLTTVDEIFSLLKRIESLGEELIDLLDEPMSEDIISKKNELIRLKALVNEKLTYLEDKSK